MTKKTCFVIMPISKTKSASQKDWAYIYDKIIKPAVEESELEFKCKRSSAERGNILKDIMIDLYDSDVVIADLTDRNPNVFYELGVRHCLKSGTIILTQNRKFASIFDLNNYASHVYSWKTLRGKKAMTEQIRKLLRGYLANSEKSDNPVSDFLAHKAVYRGATQQQLKDIVEFDVYGIPQIILDKKKLSGRNAVGFLLLANAEKGVSLGDLTNQVSRSWKRLSNKNVARILNGMGNWVIKEGPKRNYVYRLSGTGRKVFLKIIDVLTQK